MGNEMISVVIPIFDRTWMLRESIESILSQTHQNFELILVTDGSPADTLEVVKQYEKHPKIRAFYYPTNSGSPCRGRNKGILEARGEYIAFQDSDDIATPRRLEISLREAKAHQADVVYGNWRSKVDHPGHQSGIADGTEVHCPPLRPGLLKEMNVLCQGTVMVRRKILIQAGGVNSKFGYLEDWELWLRLEYCGARFIAVPEVLTNLRLHDSNSESIKCKEIEKWKTLMFQEYDKLPRFPMKIAYLLPGTGISGGVGVILQHTNRLMERGHEVILILTSGQDSWDLSWFPNNKVPVLSYHTPYQYRFHNIDHLVATGWQTVEYLCRIDAKNKYYFVQSDERRFSEDLEFKSVVDKTYRSPVNYITEAIWIQKWLASEYGHYATWVPNGLDINIFHPVQVQPHRPRVLIEGPISIPFKGVADCIKAIAGIGCEVWMVSNAGTPDPSWKIDKFFSKVPMDKMREIYSDCDVLLKMSQVEGFFGPPMEAMACGCAVVCSKVTGYSEYIDHEKNALVVESGDIAGARAAVVKILADPFLKNSLVLNGYNTVKQWPWAPSIDRLEYLFGSTQCTELSFQTDIAKLSNLSLPVLMSLFQDLCQSLS